MSNSECKVLLRDENESVLCWLVFKSNGEATVSDCRVSDDWGANVAKDCERFGAQGITVHPRPDERHIRYDDVRDLEPLVKTELNIEGYPNKEFIDLVLQVKPTQVTLVPDPPGVLTSNAGWNTIKNEALLTDVITEFQMANIRTSIFIDTDLAQIENVPKIGADRIELYTESYAVDFSSNKEAAVAPFVVRGEQSAAPIPRLPATGRVPRFASAWDETALRYRE